MEAVVSDVAFISLSILFFALSFGYLALCDRLIK